MKIRRMNDGILEICDENGTVIMSISEELNDEIMSIKISGEIRNDVAHEFEDEVMAAFSVCKEIRIDLNKATYIASIALRSLLSIQQVIDESNDAKMVLCNLSDEIKQIFDDSGFSDILYIEE